jgi:choline dehydrogenase-like flavoprotein
MERRNGLRLWALPVFNLDQNRAIVRQRLDGDSHVGQLHSRPDIGLGSHRQATVRESARRLVRGKLLTDDRYVWKFQTEPQAAMKGQSIYWPRGKVLGGSSAVNGMAVAGKVDVIRHRPE